MSSRESDLVDRLDGALPGFRDHCWSAENLFQEGGEITVQGVFLTCAEFVGDHSDSLPPEAWSRLARIINELASGMDKEFYNAVCTCFLEKVAGEVPDLERFLRGAAKEYWDEWK